MIASSATAGQPVRPSMLELTPSFICAPSVSRGSWACWAMTPSKALTYSSARRISDASLTHLPSSEKTRTRAAESAMVPSSAISLPARPTVTAPTGKTSQWPCCWPSRQTCSTTPAVSATGSVLAIAWTAVKPPTAAAWVPVSTVSASSRPGSRRWVCRSTRPGSSTQPVASSSSSPVRSVPIAVMTPSSRTTSTGSPSPYRVTFLTTQLTAPPPCKDRRSLRSLGAPDHRLGTPEQQVEDGHPDADAVGDLVLDGGAQAVGDLARDLHAADHRAGVHDDGVVLERPDAVDVEAVSAGVLARTGEVRRAHPLALDAQHHDDV